VNRRKPLTDDEFADLFEHWQDCQADGALGDERPTLFDCLGNLNANNPKAFTGPTKTTGPAGCTVEPA